MGRCGGQRGPVGAAGANGNQWGMGTRKDQLRVQQRRTADCRDVSPRPLQAAPIGAWYDIDLVIVCMFNYRNGCTGFSGESDITEECDLYVSSAKL